MLTRAILRRPGAAFAAGLTKADLGAPELSAMLAQHEAYAAALAALGLEIELLEPLPDYPDAYFVEDVAVIIPELAVVCRPGAPSRRGEADEINFVLARHRPVANLTGTATLEGGDVLIVDKQVIVGLSSRTNPEGAEQLGRLLAPHGYALRTAPVAGGLHLKSSVTQVSKGTLLATEAFAGLPALDGFTVLTAAPGEEFAANTLLLNGTLLMPAGAPKTMGKLKALGVPIVALEISEARKMDGGLTCMSLRL